MINNRGLCYFSRVLGFWSCRPWEDGLFLPDVYVTMFLISSACQPYEGVYDKVCLFQEVGSKQRIIALCGCNQMSQFIRAGFFFFLTSLPFCVFNVHHLCVKFPGLIIHSCKSERVNSHISTYSTICEAHMRSVKVVADETRHCASSDVSSQHIRCLI